MPFRYTDLDTVKSPYDGFAVRRRFPTLLEVFLIAAWTIIFGVCISLSIDNRLAVAAVLFTLGGMLSLFATTQIRKSRDLLRSTEFQNALLAAALGMDCAFCLIAQENGTIAYLNRGFKEHFREFVETGDTTLKGWLDAGGASSAETLDAAVRQERKEITLIIRSHKGPAQRYRLSAIPLSPLRGFTLLRGIESLATGN